MRARAAWTAVDGVGALERGAACPGGTDAVRWFARPDGEPVSPGWAGHD